MAQTVRVKRFIQPAMYHIRIEPDPESADQRAKRLVVWLPLEAEELVMPLNEETLAYLNDATMPGLYDAADLPDPPGLPS